MRAFATRGSQTRDAKGRVEAGVIADDPKEIGQMMWAVAHGAVGLARAGDMPAGTARGLLRHMNGAIARGVRPGA